MSNEKQIITAGNLAASEMEAALARLNIQPGYSTEAELEQDDAEILPALVDGQPVITLRHV